MFRRVTVAVLAAGALGFAFVGGTARASGAQVIRDHFHGPFAEAGWETSTSTSITDAAIIATQEQDGTTHLAIFDLHTTYLDASGNVTGSLDVRGELNAGGSVAFDTVGLTTASASGTVPVTRCTFDAAGNPTGCTDGTLDVSATWTGQGDIARGSFWENHFVSAGNFVFLDRLSGTFRLASATATIGGQAFDSSSLQFADMGVSNQMTALICPHGC
jgi:hypothetical protein